MTVIVTPKYHKLRRWSDNTFRSYSEPPVVPVSVGSLSFLGNALADSGRLKVSVNSLSYPANIGNTDFTIEMWIRPSSTAANNPRPQQTGSNQWTAANIFFDRDYAGGTPGFGMSIGDGIVHFGGDSNSQELTVSGGPDIRDGAWHHVAATRAVSNGEVALYVNGTRYAYNATSVLTGDMRFNPGTYADQFICTATDNASCAFADPYMAFGCEKADVSGGPYDFYGDISEVRLSNTIRYSGTGFTVPSAAFTTDSNTMLLFHFSEQTGTTTEDASGNGGTGSLLVSANGPTWSTDNPFS